MWYERWMSWRGAVLAEVRLLRVEALPPSRVRCWRRGKVVVVGGGG